MYFNGYQGHSYLREGAQAPELQEEREREKKVNNKKEKKNKK